MITLVVDRKKNGHTIQTYRCGQCKRILYRADIFPNGSFFACTFQIECDKCKTIFTPDRKLIEV